MLNVRRYEYTSSFYPLGWVLLFSIPLLVWAAGVAFLRLLARIGKVEMRTNLLAFLGALLGFVSLMTAWEVIVRGYDWSMSAGCSLFLLFTYPLAVVTPLAAIGQTGVMVYTRSYANDQGASIEPMYGYVIAWVSVVLMFASMVLPIGTPIGREKSTIADRLLTMMARRLKTLEKQ